MSVDEDNPEATGGDARRERLLSDLELLRRSLRGANRRIGFADVRADFPDLARILFCGRDLRRTDLRGADLRGIDFRGADLSGCDFSSALIHGARFDRAKVSRQALMRAEDWALYRANWEAYVDPEETAARSLGFRRDPGERFSFSPLLPELVILSDTFLSNPPKLDDHERRALDAGRLAIAVRGLTNREMVQLAAPDRLAEADEATALRPGYAARSYCWELTRRGTALGLPRQTQVRLPGYALFHALATSVADLPAESVRASETDVCPADLRLGADGHEFVRTGEDDELAVATTGPSFGLAAYPMHPLSAGERHAVVRPIFLLGHM